MGSNTPPKHRVLEMQDDVKFQKKIKGNCVRLPNLITTNVLLLRGTRIFNNFVVGRSFITTPSIKSYQVLSHFSKTRGRVLQEAKFG